MDLLRRFILSGSKFLNWISLLTFLLETFYALDIEQADTKYYSSFILFAFLGGGFFEPVLSFFPKLNRAILPVWNSVFQFIENSLLKICAFIIFVCPPVNVGYNQYQTTEVCAKNNINNTLYMLIPIFFFSAITGYMEHAKYRDSVNKNLRSKNAQPDEEEECIPSLALVKKLGLIKKSLYFSKQRLCRVSLSGLNTLISILSFTSAVDYYLIILGTHKEFRNKVVPLTFFILVPLMFMFSCMAQFCGKDRQNKCEKFSYFLNELLRPSSGNWHAGDHLILSIDSLLFGAYYKGMGGHIRILPITFFLAVCNPIRAHDAYQYKYTLFNRDEFSYSEGSAKIIINDNKIDGEENDLSLASD